MCHELISRFGVPAEPFGDFMAAANDLAGEQQPGTTPARRYLSACQRRKQLVAETPAQPSLHRCIMRLLPTSDTLARGR